MKGPFVHVHVHVHVRVRDRGRRRAGAAAALLTLALAGAAGCGGKGDAGPDAARPDGCGVLDPAAGGARFCSPAGNQMCVCATGRCATIDLGCLGRYRYVDGRGECVSRDAAESVIESTSEADLCPGTGADADADADDAGDEAEIVPDVDADAVPVCGNGIREAGEDCDGDAPASCTTTCDTAGERRCVSCAWEAGCRPPPETCNGRDDDCDTILDNVGGTFGCGDGCCNGSETYCSCPADCTTAVPPPSPPRPVVPANGALTGSHRVPASLMPAFRWFPPASGGCGTAAYDIQVDDSCAIAAFRTCGFLSPEAAATSVAGVSWSPPTALPVSTSPPVGRRYWWRVRACDGAAGCSDWTTPRYVEVGRVPSDFNGDGFSDLAVGAPARYGAVTDPGAVAVYYGGSSGIVTTGPTLILGRQGDAEFGGALAALDANIDGFADLAVGAPRHDAGTRDEGNIFVFRGSSTGLPTSPNDVVDSPYNQQDAQFGFSLSTAGDVDYDGYPDLLVGSPDQLDLSGPAYVLRGPRLWTFPDVPIAVPNPEPDMVGSFGMAVSAAGDFDADGFLDVAVGAPYWGPLLGSPPMRTPQGAVFLFRGGAADVTYVGRLDPPAPADFADFGSSIALAGDLQGDGFPELVVGASGYNGGAPTEGNVFVYFASAAGYPAAPSIAIDNPTNEPWARFGNAVSSAATVENGRPTDLLIGAREQDAGSTDEGNAFLYRAGATTYPTAPDMTIDNPTGQESSGFGSSVGLGWDFNGDGWADAAVGAPWWNNAGRAHEGRVWVYHGTPTGLGTVPLSIPSPWAVAGAEFGAALGRAL